jgi:predicted RNA-binding protein with PIN domain
LDRSGQRQEFLIRKSAAMQFLIDGYNLMHFLGLVRPQGPKSLEKSRINLQEWLRQIHGPKINTVTLVYDGRVTEKRTTAVQDDHGLRIHFSEGEAADDLIEELIRKNTLPRQLTVVSNDRRIQEAARRRGAKPSTCSEYLDYLMDQGHAPPKPPKTPEKPAASADETAHWMKEFGALDDDPELRRFNKMYRDFNDS